MDRTASLIGGKPLPGGPGLRAPTMHDAILLIGFATLAVPTLLNLARLSWSTEAGAHGPIVLATAGWLLWREREHLSAGSPPAPWLGVTALLFALILYVAGRVTSILMIETLALYLVMLSTLFLCFGGTALRKLWFPLIYLLFLITPPENWVFVATRPLKMALSQIAVDLLANAGLMVGNSGPMIQIDGYQLLVATACSGLNSLIGISAISLFYVYLRHGDEPRYAFVLLLLLLPIAVLTNLLRIIGLVLATHWLGPDVVEGFIHDAAGIATFMLALLLLLIIDATLFRFLCWLGWMRVS